MPRLLHGQLDAPGWRGLIVGGARTARPRDEKIARRAADWATLRRGGAFANVSADAAKPKGGLAHAVALVRRCMMRGCWRAANGLTGIQDAHVQSRHSRPRPNSPGAEQALVAPRKRPTFSPISSSILTRPVWWQPFWPSSWGLAFSPRLLPYAGAWTFSRPSSSWLVLASFWARKG